MNKASYLRSSRQESKGGACPANAGREPGIESDCGQLMKFSVANENTSYWLRLSHSLFLNTYIVLEERY